MLQMQNEVLILPVWQQWKGAASHDESLHSYLICPHCTCLVRPSGKRYARVICKGTDWSFCYDGGNACRGTAAFVRLPRGKEDSEEEETHLLLLPTGNCASDVRRFDYQCVQWLQATMS